MTAEGADAARKITARIEGLGDWRSETLARVRELIHDADPEVVRLTFFRGASLADPKTLFNSSLEGNTRRAIDIRDGEKLDEAAFEELIRSAVAANSEAQAHRARKKK